MTKRSDDLIAAIDVGTNAVRLEIARVKSDGTLETIHAERDAVRPGEGLFTSGTIRREIQDRLVAALARFNALCRRYDAKVRAVATSALREAKNRDDVVNRVRAEANLSLEVISGREEARLICLGVFQGFPASIRSLCIDIGGGSTEVIVADGDRPRDLWSVELGAVRMTEFFKAKGRVNKKHLRLMREFALEKFDEAQMTASRGALQHALGSSGTIEALVAFAARESAHSASAADIARAVEAIAQMDLEKRERRFDASRAEVILGGAVVLEAVMGSLKIPSIRPTDRGLRDGVLYDLLGKRGVGYAYPSLGEASLAIGRRLGFGEPHAVQVSGLALQLFDALAPSQQLPRGARPWLEAAAFLHDVGYAVSASRHHKHAHYLILNSDIPGLSDRERGLVAAIARFHRRSPPDTKHPLMQQFTEAERKIVQKCAVILRVADALDRSHHQPVEKLSISLDAVAVRFLISSRHPIDLEMWDLDGEADLFREVFSKTLVVRRRRLSSRAKPMGQQPRKRLGPSTRLRARDR